MRKAIAAALAVGSLPAGVAWADETIRAVTPNRFATPVTTIDQGEKVTLQNLDVAGHDVTSRAKSSAGKPLFSSALIAPGGEGPVKGTEYLTTGTYPFVCSVHPGMEATLAVTAAGTPAQKPDPPAVRLRVKSGDLERVVARGKLVVTVASTPASVRLSATARAGKTVKLGSKTVSFGDDGSKTVALSLPKKARQALARRERAKVTVVAAATDEAGQTTKASATRTLR